MQLILPLGNIIIGDVAKMLAVAQRVQVQIKVQIHKVEIRRDSTVNRFSCSDYQEKDEQSLDRKND